MRVCTLTSLRRFTIPEVPPASGGTGSGEGSLRDNSVNVKQHLVSFLGVEAPKCAREI